MTLIKARTLAAINRGRSSRETRDNAPVTALPPNTASSAAPPPSIPLRSGVWLSIACWKPQCSPRRSQVPSVLAPRRFRAGDHYDEADLLADGVESSRMLADASPM